MTPVVLAWDNENTLSPYPLTKSFGYDSLLIDANFVQFDSFIPVLKSIQLTDDSITLIINFDFVTKKLVYTISELVTPGATKTIKHNDRYLGTLVFGTGIGKFINSNGNQTLLTVNIPFLAHTVRSIPSKAGVFTLDDKYGNLTFLSDNYISYDVTDNDVTFNAVAYPALSNEPYLKTLNSVGPTNNSVFIKNTDIIKVAGDSSTVTVSLVGTRLESLTKANAILVTTDGGAQ